VGKGKKVDVYLEVRKRRGHIFNNQTNKISNLSNLDHVLNNI
jgi:hypothetical protein